MKTLLVVLSEGCNLNCAYCGVDKKSTKTIDPLLYLAEFAKLRAKNPTDTIKIDFFGGEPLMQLPLVRQIIDGVRLDNNVKLFMPTNGLLLTDSVVEYLIESGVEVSLSFDGLWQDKNRLQLTGKGTLQRILDKRELLSRIPGLRVHAMITRGCYNLLENYLFIKNQLGINAELTLVRDVGTWNEASVNKLLIGVHELVDWYIDHPDDGMPFFIRFYLRHFLNYHVSNHTTDNCGAGDTITMFVDNKILPCTRFKASPELIQEIPKYLRMNECQTCEVRQYCEKGCLFEQIKNKGPIQELCTIYKSIYKEVSRMTQVLIKNPHFTKVITEEIELCQQA